MDSRDLDELRKKAEQGDAEAQLKLGGLYYQGTEVAQDKIEAVKWYQKAAEQGNATKTKTKFYVKLFQKAAEQGNPKAQFNLALCYYNGDGVEKNPQLAWEWFQKAAEQGNPKAQFYLALCYENGDGVEKNSRLACEWLQKAAEQGLAEAQFNLALSYYYGDGIEKKPRFACEWFQKAAEQGFDRAQYNLAQCHAKGNGVEKNLRRAYEWFQKAAKQGDAEAQFNLALCYANGDGVEKNLQLAREWYQKAAEQDNAKAQFNLALCYRHGDGVKKNPRLAYKWNQKAAEQGCAEAQFNLACCYHNGDSVEKNTQLACEWYQKAAEQGLAEAQFNLAVSYHNGDGVEKNTEKANHWFEKCLETIIEEISVQYKSLSSDKNLSNQPCKIDSKDIIDLPSVNLVEKYTFTNGSEVPVWEISDCQAFNQFVGYAKYLNANYGRVFCRGERNLHKSLTSSLTRLVTQPNGKQRYDEAKKRLSDIREQIDAHEKLKQIFLSGSTPNDQNDILEALLQHYGFYTNFIDVVDNHWTALWFGLHSLEKTSKNLSIYRNRVKEYPVKKDGNTPLENLYQYVLLIACDYPEKDSSKHVHRGKDIISIDLRSNISPIFQRPHAQHGFAIRRNPDSSQSEDLADNVVAIIKIRVVDAERWLGEGKLLSRETLFPAYKYDYGYKLMLLYPEIFGHPENGITNFAQ